MSGSPEVERGLAEFMRISKKNGVDTGNPDTAKIIRLAFLAGGEWFGVMTVKAAMAQMTATASERN